MGLTDRFCIDRNLPAISLQVSLDLLVRLEIDNDPCHLVFENQIGDSFNQQSVIDPQRERQFTKAVSSRSCGPRLLQKLMLNCAIDCDRRRTHFLAWSVLLLLEKEKVD
jgi:hypothetical protein